MALNSRNLSVLAYSNGFTIWHYKTLDPSENIYEENYFAKVANIFNLGDVIFITANGATEFATVYEAGAEILKLRSLK